MSGFLKALNEKRRRFDWKMKKRYSPARLALLCCMLIFLLASYMLFFPPYIGLSDDGSYAAVLSDTGLGWLNEEASLSSYSYYERVFVLDHSQYRADSTPLPLRAVISAAVWIDTLISGDVFFDMRTLAAIYLALYLAAIYPVIRFTLERVRYYSEGLVVAVLCVLVFGDVSVVSRFASLSTQPMEYLGMLALVGALVHLRTPGQEAARLFEMTASAVLLVMVNAYCGAAAIVLSAVCWYSLRNRKSFGWKTACVGAAIGLCFLGVAGLNEMNGRMTATQKYNAMTRGVLFQADDPVEALAQFDIEPRYSVLAGTYGDQNYPVVLPEDGLLDKGFLDKYTASDIAFYYVRHPGNLINMFDEAVKRAFNTRSDYSGNYERSTGMPARAKSPFMAVWSRFKSESAPKTAVAFVGLVIAEMALLWSGRRKADARGQNLHLSFVVCLMMIFSTVELITVFVFSGDSEMIRESYLMGSFIDFLSILFVGEALRKIDVIRGEDEA